MTETRVLNPQTQVVREKTEKAKKILFSPISEEVEDIAQKDLDRFSNAYESEKLQRIIDNHDMQTYLETTNTVATNKVIAPKTNHKHFQDLLQTQNIQSVQTEQKVLSKPKVKVDKQVNAKLNFRGKLMISAFCIISLLFGFLAIFNAFDIKNMNTEIDNLTAEVTQSEAHLSELWQTYSNLNNASRVTGLVEENGMSAIPSENQISVELGLSEEQTVSKSTNWFDAICDFIGGIFG